VARPGSPDKPIGVISEIKKIPKYAKIGAHPVFRGGIVVVRLNPSFMADDVAFLDHHPVLSHVDGSSSAVERSKWRIFGIVPLLLPMMLSQSFVPA